MALRAQRFTTFDRLKLLLILSALIAQCTVLHGVGTAAPVSIKRSEHLSVDGAKLYLQIRGADTTAPVLLWLHGGPGVAEWPLFRYFNDDLEKRFVVVYWDQRSAGRSFDPKADLHRLTIAQHVADLDAVVDHLRKSLGGQNKIVLMGHSWGAALGALYAQAYPEKVSAFVGVNPLIATLKGRRRNTISSARRRVAGELLFCFGVTMRHCVEPDTVSIRQGHVDLRRLSRGSSRAP